MVLKHPSPPFDYFLGPLEYPVLCSCILTSATMALLPYLGNPLLAVRCHVLVFEASSWLKFQTDCSFKFQVPYHRHFITFHTMDDVMGIEAQVVRDETPSVFYLLYVAVNDVHPVLVDSQRYLTRDKQEDQVGPYLGLRESPEEAVERLRQITLKTEGRELQKTEIVVIKFAFTAAAFAKYTFQCQNHPPFASLLSKRLYLGKQQENKDWGVWYFRGEKLLLDETDETGNTLVSSSMYRLG